MTLATRSVTDVIGEDGARIITWSTLDADDDALPVRLGDWRIRSVQADGTFGDAGSCSIQGSNTAASGSWIALTSDGTNAIALTDSTPTPVFEDTLYVKPLATAGDGTTALVITAYATKR